MIQTFFMKLVTIVFFEFPAALTEINFWEQSMLEKIKTKIVKAPDTFIYKMHSGEELQCFNNDYFSFDTICSQFLIEKHTFYNKTLLFGKFNVQQLEKIMRVILSVDKYTVK